MKKNKNFNLNTNSISSLISDLENLSKNIDDMSKKITGQSIWLNAGNDGGSIEGHIV